MERIRPAFSQPAYWINLKIGLSPNGAVTQSGNLSITQTPNHSILQSQNLSITQSPESPRGGIGALLFVDLEGFEPVGEVVEAFVVGAVHLERRDGDVAGHHPGV